MLPGPPPHPSKHADSLVSEPAAGKFDIPGPDTAAAAAVAQLARSACSDTLDHTSVIPQQAEALQPFVVNCRMG